MRVHVWSRMGHYDKAGKKITPPPFPARGTPRPYYQILQIPLWHGPRSLQILHNICVNWPSYASGYRCMSAFDLRSCSMSVVEDLCREHHGYGSAGKVATYAFAVFENERAIAAFSWQPPPPGAANSVCPEAPFSVLSLSRMVAVPKNERKLKHISKPLRTQMKKLIDRTRWPVLVTYSDEGQGHTGYVYKCSGWTPTRRRKTTTFVDALGARKSRYSDGSSVQSNLTRGPDTWIQRWEEWATPVGTVVSFMQEAKWRRVPIGGIWRSGSPRYTIAKVA